MQKHHTTTNYVISTMLITCAVAVEILVPPEAPTVSWTLPSARSTTAGVLDDSGRFPVAMKLAYVRKSHVKGFWLYTHRRMDTFL